MTEDSLVHSVIRFNSPTAAKLLSVFTNLSGVGRFGFLLTLLAIWRRFGGKVVMKHGKVVNFFPSFLYDFVNHAFFLVNSVIDVACYFQPDKSEWNEEEDKSVSVQALKDKIPDGHVAEVSKQILKQEDVAYVEADLVRLYDSLPAVKTEELLVGRVFNGKILRTNRSILDLAEWFIVRPISYLGINWGKRYITQHRGDPLLFNWGKSIYVPIPLWGNVGVADIKWRGVSTGTMNYDHQAWKDYFRVLEHDPATKRLVLLGVWTSRTKAGGWFTLTWDPSVPIE